MFHALRYFSCCCCLCCCHYLVFCSSLTKTHSLLQVPCLVGLGSLLVEEGNKEEGEKLLAEATGVLLCPSFVSVPVGRTHSGGALDGLVTMKDLHPPKPVMRSMFHVGADAVIAVHRMEKEAQRARERRQTEENSFERAKSN